MKPATVLRLDPWRYPTRAAFHLYTYGRTGTLRITWEEYYRKFYIQGYHNTYNRLKEALQHAEQAFEVYLDIHVRWEVGSYGSWCILEYERESFRTYGGPIFEPSFTDSVSTSPGLTRISTLIEQAEANLVHPWFDFLSTHPTLLADSHEFEEYLLWRRVVRICTVVTLLRGLDFEHFWKNLDGDAGWFLSERVPELCAWLQAQPTWKEIYATLLPSDSPWRELGFYSALRQHLQSVAQMQVASPKWRSLARSGKDSVSQLGVSFPASFYHIPDNFGVSGPQYYGRPKLWYRLRLVRQFWEYCRTKIGLSDDNLRYSFSVIAAALNHGGKHPPHNGHRTGSEVDLDLDCLPDLVDHTSGVEVKLDLLSGETEILDGAGEPADEYDTFFTLSGDWVFPQSQEEWLIMNHKFARCRFPPVPDRIYVAEWNLVARKFTQCIYLTFPGSIIFASQNISVEAREQLIQKVTDLIVREIDKQNPDLARIIMLRRVHSLLHTIRPVVWLDMDAKKAAKMRFDHRHHWHVSYYPPHLGDEGPFTGNAKISSDKNETLAMMVHIELWKELLAE